MPPPTMAMLSESSSMISVMLTQFTEGKREVLGEARPYIHEVSRTLNGDRDVLDKVLPRHRCRDLPFNAVTILSTVADIMTIG